MIQKKKFSDAIAANISVVGELIGTATSEKNGLLPMTKYDMAIETNLSTYLSGGVFIFDTGLIKSMDQYAIFEISHIDSNGTFQYANLLLAFTNATQIYFKKDGSYDKTIKLFTMGDKVYLYFETSNKYARFSIKVRTSSHTTKIVKTDLTAIPEEAENITVAE